MFARYRRPIARLLDLFAGPHTLHQLGWDGPRPATEACHSLRVLEAIGVRSDRSESVAGAHTPQLPAWIFSCGVCGVWEPQRAGTDCWPSLGDRSGRYRGRRGRAEPAPTGGRRRRAATRDGNRPVGGQGGPPRREIPLLILGGASRPLSDRATSPEGGGGVPGRQAGRTSL
jgi:hypothetical protein